MRISGDKFTLVLNQLSLGSGEQTIISNSSLGGQITNGTAVFNRREGKALLVMTSDTLTARGSADISWTDQGLKLTGYFEGDMNFVMKKDPVSSQSLGASTSGAKDVRALIAGDYTVMSTTGEMAHLRGRVAFTEAGLLPFTDGTHFKTTEKARCV